MAAEAFAALGDRAGATVFAQWPSGLRIPMFGVDCHGRVRPRFADAGSGRGRGTRMIPIRGASAARLYEKGQSGILVRPLPAPGHIGRRGRPG